MGQGSNGTKRSSASFGLRAGNPLQPPAEERVTNPGGFMMEEPMGCGESGDDLGAVEDDEATLLESVKVSGYHSLSPGGVTLFFAGGCRGLPARRPKLAEDRFVTLEPCPSRAIALVHKTSSASDHLATELAISLVRHLPASHRLRRSMWRGSPLWTTTHISHQPLQTSENDRSSVWVLRSVLTKIF